MSDKKSINMDSFISNGKDKPLTHKPMRDLDLSKVLKQKVQVSQERKAVFKKQSEK